MYQDAHILCVQGGSELASYGLTSPWAMIAAKKRTSMERKTTSARNVSMLLDGLSFI